jgi:hypothetical protein
LIALAQNAGSLFKLATPPFGGFTQEIIPKHSDDHPKGQKKPSTGEKAAETPGSDHLADYRRKTCRLFRCRRAKKAAALLHCGSTKSRKLFKITYDAQFTQEIIPKPSDAAEKAAETP